MTVLALAIAACGGDEGEDTMMGPPAPGPAAGLAFVNPPSGATAGAEIAPGVQVAIQDASGNSVADAMDAVTVELAENPAGGTLLGTLTVNAVDGVATFSDLAIERAGAGYRLGVSSGELDEAVSEAFAITPAEPAELAMLSEPGTGEGQVPFDPAVEVAIRDEFGNVVTGAAAEVTIGLSASPSGEALGGTTTVPAVDGVAVFDDLSLALPGDGFVLEASSGALPAVASAEFSVRLTFVQLGPGWNHTCGVTAGDFAYCWGLDGNGQLGNGPAGDRHTPTPVAGGFRFAQVSASSFHTCGVTTDNIAYCWGLNGSGQLGDGTTEGRDTPTPVAGGVSFARVSAGEGFTCGITTGTIAYCWGNNASGQLGDGTTVVSHTPTPVTGGLSFARLSAGSSHTCGVTPDNIAYCWGNNGSGKLGDDTNDDRHTPTAVAGGSSFAEVSAGHAHTCGVTTGNIAYCWGSNVDGQLGDTTSTGFARRTPVPVTGDFSFALVRAGEGHTCGVTTGNIAYCWGHNIDGRLGDGTTGDRNEPTPVVGGFSFARVGAGREHTCGITTGDIAYCWGSNERGQLGDGTVDGGSTPTRVVQ